MLQNKVATGKLTLLGSSIYGVIVAMAIGALSQGLWVQSASLAVATVCMVVLNNSNSLIRIYSRLVSCSFLVLSLAASFLLPSITGGVEQILFILALQFLFKSYQKRQEPASFYCAFVCLGCISVTCIHVLYYVPILLLSSFTSLQAGSPRNLGAALLGLLTPYWVLLPYALFNDSCSIMLHHFCELIVFQPVAVGLFESHLFVTLLFIGILGITGCVHYMRYSFEDSIRTRMFYNMLMLVFLFTLVFIILQPQQYDLLLRVLIISASPLIAQYFVFTRSRISNITFIVSCILTLALTAYNAWIS